MSDPVSYNPAFFSKIVDGSLLSARQVVPELIQLLQPRSVVDLGCGTGAWLAAFQEKGIAEIQGFDGSYVDRKTLLIPQDRFQPHDLTQPLRLDHKFDVAISVEVAEHLPASAAATFIESLTALSDVIVFSAAIPLQGGEHHVNEQWPEYWRDLFQARGFKVIDCLRRKFWDNRDVERWYRQNLLLYVKEDRLRTSPQLQAEYEKTKDAPLALVHPAVYLAPAVSAVLRMFPRSLLSGIRRRLKRN
jgi:SAM-dependent methyltransferase